MNPALAFHIYSTGGRTRGLPWRWRLMSHNGALASSEHGYATKRGAVKACQRFARLPLGDVPVVE